MLRLSANVSILHPTHGVNGGLLTLSEKRELRTAPLGLRITPSLKAALERSAEADRRSVASMVEVILTQWLEEHGYLPGSE